MVDDVVAVDGLLQVLQLLCESLGLPCRPAYLIPCPSTSMEGHPCPTPCPVAYGVNCKTHCLTLHSVATGLIDRVVKEEDLLELLQLLCEHLGHLHPPPAPPSSPSSHLAALWPQG